MGWKASRVGFDAVQNLERTLDVPEIVAWTLVRRGLDTPERAREFMAVDGPLDAPDDIPGVVAIAERLLEAIRRQQRIAIHGDYDCDGVCATAILAHTLRLLGAEVRTFLPSRFTDGYGVRSETVERLAEDGIDVLVCVDCGTTATDALERAVELGIEPLICDHHLAGGVRPPGLMANPALGRIRDDAPAAVGVVFSVIRAISERCDGVLAPDPTHEIDLVALATVADAVPLIGQNRRFVARGIAQMRREPRMGIQALCRAAGLDPRTIDARNLGYTLAPVINAAGRLGHPDDALALLLCDDQREADRLAAALWQQNADRRDLEQQVTEEAIAQIDASPSGIRDAHITVAIGDDWHEGVIGIVASRLVERFDRPALVLTRGEDTTKGSGRSLPGIDLHDLLGSAATHLTRWGGHAGAVGLQLANADVHEFRADLIAAADHLGPALHRARIREVDAIVGARDMSLATAEAFEPLAPFGRGNPAPLFVVPAAFLEKPRTMGSQRQHLEVRLHSGGAHTRAVGFGHGHRARDLTSGTRADVIARLGIERYQGLTGPRVTVERLESLDGASSATGGCCPACDATCTMRRPLLDIQEALTRSVQPRGAPSPGRPKSVTDHRGAGTGMIRAVALANADNGVAIVVADVALRRAALIDTLAPQRIGSETIVLVSARCAPQLANQRAHMLLSRPGVLIIDYDSLARTTIPDGVHLLALDPPASEEDVRAFVAASANRHVHLEWGAAETAFARTVAEQRFQLRGVATQIWRALSVRDRWEWDSDLDLALAGSARPSPRPDAIIDVLTALGELGYCTISDSGLGCRTPDPAPPLAHAPRIQLAETRGAEARNYLNMAQTIDLFDTGDIHTIDVATASVQDMRT